MAERRYLWVPINVFFRGNVDTGAMSSHSILSTYSTKGRFNLICQLSKVSCISDLMIYLGNSCLMVHLLVLSQLMKVSQSVV